ncbi:MAG: 30S ribosomal protein S20 [Deltaproteobacteria bacterium]|nr:30S ribosomal protein S20 [Deltaproteobacteria bacterium]
MSKSSSAEKRHKQSLKRKIRNRHIRSTVKSAVKEVRTALSGSDAPKAVEILKETSSVIARAGSKGVLHKKTVARKVSRLSKAVHKATKK